MNIEEIAKLAPWKQFGMPEAVVMLILGILLLFVGYRIKKVAFFVIWFLLGFNLVQFLMPTITQMVPKIAANDLWQMLLPIGGGLLLALMGFSIEKLCVGGACFALTMIITVRYFGSDMQVLAIGGIAGIIAAGVAVIMMKPATIIATAVAGGYAIVTALPTLGLNINIEEFYWPILLGTAAVGAVIQFMTTKRMR